MQTLTCVARASRGTPSNTAQQLTEKFKFIDKEKICVWGWSYGGYVADMIMAVVGLEQSGEISCGYCTGTALVLHWYWAPLLPTVVTSGPAQGLTVELRKSLYERRGPAASLSVGLPPGNTPCRHKRRHPAPCC